MTHICIYAGGVLSVYLIAKQHSRVFLHYAGRYISQKWSLSDLGGFLLIIYCGFLFIMCSGLLNARSLLT